MTEPLPHFTPDEREYIKRKKLFEELLAFPAWQELEKILQAQYDAQISALVTPPHLQSDGLSQVLTSEYRKGAAFGIRLALSTPRATIKNADEILETYRQPKEDLNVPGNTSTSSRRVDLNDDELDLPEHVRVSDLGGTESE